MFSILLFVQSSIFWQSRQFLLNLCRYVVHHKCLLTNGVVMVVVGGALQKKMRNQVMAKTGVYYSYKSKITLGKEPF